MRIPRQRRTRQLERRLRAERPQPSESLLLTLASQSRSPARAPGARALPWPAVAVAVAATLALVAALVAAGVAGYATRSVHTFGRSLAQVVHSRPARTAPSVAALIDNRPSQIQLGATVGVCESPLIVEVPIQEVFYRLLHGAKPVSACFGPG